MAPGRHKWGLKPLPLIKSSFCALLPPTFHRGRTCATPGPSASVRLVRGSRRTGGMAFAGAEEVQVVRPLALYFIPSSARLFHGPHSKDSCSDVWAWPQMCSASAAAVLLAEDGYEMG